MSDMSPTTDTATFAHNIAGAVRAELARRGKTVTELTNVIGWSSRTTYRRLNGDAAFTVDELELIANWLHVDVQVLIDSAEIGSRYGAVA